MAMSTGKLVNKQALRPTTGRRHSKEVLLLHRAAQLGCHNQFGWSSRVCSNGIDLLAEVDYQPSTESNDCCFNFPEQNPVQYLPTDLLVEVDHQPSKESKDCCLNLAEKSSAQYFAQEPELDCLPIRPPPGLPLCAVNSSSHGKDNFLFLDDTPPAMTTDAILAGCDRENISCDSFFACPRNQSAPPMKVTPKSSLHICLADCIDDTSTAASESSPELFPRDLVDGTNSNPSSSKGTPEQKLSPMTIPSILEGLNFTPKTQSVPSLAEALAFAPTTSVLNHKRKTPISLEAMAPATPTVNRAGIAPISLEVTASTTSTISQTGTVPISLEVMAPATPTMNQAGKAPISLDAMTPVTPTSSQTGKTQISLEAMAPTTPKMNQTAKAAISLEAMLEFSPVGKKQSPGLDGAVKEASWNPPQVSPSMVPVGGVSPWWFAGYLDVSSPSNDNHRLLAKSATGFHNAAAFWPAGTWGHSIHTDNVPGSAESMSRASSGTSDTSEVFQI